MLFLPSGFILVVDLLCPLLHELCVGVLVQLLLLLFLGYLIVEELHDFLLSRAVLPFFLKVLFVGQLVFFNTLLNILPLLFLLKLLVFVHDVFAH